MIGALRIVMADARARRDYAAVVEIATQLSRALAARPQQAAGELEDAVSWLRGRPGAEEATSELLAALAGLYTRLGDAPRAARARAAAAAAY